jgi:enediyne biosynthesis protein E4
MRNEGLDANGIPIFTDVSKAVGADDIRDARGMATADFDNDGDLDIVIGNNPGDAKVYNANNEHARATFLRNELGNTRNWLAVELEGTESNRDGIGAVVTIATDGSKQMRHAHIGSSYASQHTTRLYFGLKDAEQVDSLMVRWPSGREEQFENIGANQLVRITEGSGTKQVTMAMKPIKAE